MALMMPGTSQKAPLVYGNESAESFSTVQSWEIPFCVHLDLPTNLPAEYAAIQNQVPALQTWLQNAYSRLEAAGASNDDAIGRVCNARLSFRNLCAATRMALMSLESGDDAVIANNYEDLRRVYQDTLQTLRNTQHREFEQVINEIPRELQEMLRSPTEGQGASSNLPTSRELTMGDTPYHPSDVTEAAPETAEGENLNLNALLFT